MPHQFSDPSIEVLVPDPTDDLVRLGREMDGGYVIPSRVVASVDMVVSLGIEDEWSFELALLTLNPSIRLVGVDGSTGLAVLAARMLRSVARCVVSLATFNRKGISEGSINLRRHSKRFARFAQFWIPPRKKFLAKMVRGTAQRSDETDWQSLQRHWTPSTRLLIKVDIEGSEYGVLQHILDSADQTACLIIEFHDIDQNWDAFVELISRLRERFRLVHCHANNWGGTFGNHQIPRVVELTFIASSLVVDNQSDGASLGPYPIAGLDFPNNPNAPDIPLDFGNRTHER